MYVHVRVRACARARVRACVRACVRVLCVCVHALARSCVHVRVCACLRVRLRVLCASAFSLRLRLRVLFVCNTYDGVWVFERRRHVSAEGGDAPRLSSTSHRLL